MTEKRRRPSPRGGGHGSLMSELRKEAQLAQKEMRRGAGFVGWKDLDDGNAVVFDIVDGFTRERTVSKEHYTSTYTDWMTPKYKLFDIDGNIIREGDIDADDGDWNKDDDFYQMPCKDKILQKIMDAKDDGSTVCYMTAHEFVEDWIPKGEKKPVPFHRCVIKFGTDEGVYGRALLTEDKK